MCETCHDGSPATDIERDITDTYHHPTNDSSYSGKHSQSEGGTASKFGNSNRHAECVDCHNPHYTRPDASTSAPDASDRIRGVSGVEVINGTAGSQPSYNYISPDVGVDFEYQLCFKCHSSWTKQPINQPDMALLFNTNNPSYHPVEDRGKNADIDPLAFTNGWGSTNTMYCSDCHASDSSLLKGPHGSQYNHILKKDYTTSSGNRAMSSNEICFDCHNYDTYADKEASDTVRKYSRFDKHAKHVTDKRLPCHICHESHGSTEYPHLIVTGRKPGITSYTESSTGGSCAGTPGTPECHTEAETYKVSYPR